MQGIGAALYEELRYSEDGQLLSSTFMDYRLPSAEEVPELALEHIVTPNPFTPLGAKGAGETGMLGPPPALCSAVEDALSPFGVKIRETPLTPDRVLDLIEKAQAKSANAKTISLTVNGKSYSGEVESRTLLAHFLRDGLRLPALIWAASSAAAVRAP